MFYECGKEELFSLVKPLWRELSIYHQGVSEYFEEDFYDDKYERRIPRMLHKEDIFVMVAKKENHAIAYIIASIDDGQGEIESLYVCPEHRGCEVGEKLMTSAMSWLYNQAPETIRVSVAFGNQVVPFYEKFGFYPRSMILMDKNTLKAKEAKVG